MAKTKSKSRTVTAPPKPVVLKSPSLSPEVGDDALLDTPATANWLGVSNQWLELARCKGYGPPFVKITARLVRYRKGDIVAYLKSRTLKQETPEKADA